jgi:hypothetical protein
MGSLRQELYFWYLLDIRTMGSFDVIEISELSQSAELPIWFPIGIILLSECFLKLQQYLSILGA